MKYLLIYRRKWTLIEKDSSGRKTEYVTNTVAASKSGESIGCWEWWQFRNVSLYFSLGSFLSGKSPREKDLTTLDGGCHYTPLLVSVLFPKNFSLLGQFKHNLRKVFSASKSNQKEYHCTPTFICTLHFFFALPGFALFLSVSAPLPSPLSEKKILACAAHKF